MKLTTTLVAALTLLFFYGCKKDAPDPNPTSFSDKIILNNPQTLPDSVVLTWSVLNDPNFAYYRVFRKDDPSGAWTNISYDINAAALTRFVDQAVPYLPYVAYQVVATLSSGPSVVSNVVTYLRPEITIVDVSPFDVQFETTSRQLYFFEKTGRIAIYNVENKQMVKSVNTGSTIGYADFGTYNGVKELYVPRNDGWIFIYNAQTLEKIDQVSVGLASSSVVFSNNLLYVSCAAWINRPLKVYSRATKSKVAESGDFELTRIKKIPNTNTELIEISTNISPTDQDYYNFDANGNFVLHRNDIYHGDHPLDATVFEFFPAGDKYITAAAGAIYSNSMVFQATLPRGNLEFTSFCFDGPSIFGGTKSKTVEVYSQTNYVFTRSIKTKAYPFRIFKDGSNGFLCVSTTILPAYNNTVKVLLESFQ